MNRPFVLLLCLAFTIGIAQTQTSTNLLVNGNFTKSTCTTAWCIFKTAGSVEGWIPDPEIEVGNGELYSDFIKNEKVAELAANANGCIYQEVKNLQPGNYELRFDHAARKAIAFDDCQFSVSFNGKVLKEFVHKNYTVNSEKFDVFLSAVTNSTVRFCSIGGVSNSYGAIIKNVSLVLTQPARPNLLVNGNFAKSACGTTWCIFKTAGSVEGWIPDPEIEIGNGEVYSNFIKNEKVVELAANGNGCIYQEVKNLQPGNYELRFDHAPRVGVAFDDCQFSVAFNGKVLKEFLHKNYTVSSEKLDIALSAVTNSTVRFCSIGGVSNGLGAILKNVSLVQLPGNTAAPAPPVVMDSTVVTTTVSAPSATTASPAHTNLILNGNFAKSACTSSWCIFKTAGSVEGWIPDPEIEVGNGEVYSDFIKNEKVVELAANANGCIYQEVKNLQPGNYELRFDHAARKALTFDDCQFSVSFGGKVLKEFLHKNYTVSSEKFDIVIDKVSNSTVRFCSIGGVSNSLGAILKNVSLVQTSTAPIAQPAPAPAPVPAPAPTQTATPTPAPTTTTQPSTSSNYVINGDFSKSTCTSAWCIFKTKDGVEGWTPEPEIQIGNGQVYSDYVQNEKVLELTPNSNGCVYQVLNNVPAGVFRLRFDHAARKRTAFDDCMFSVYLNGKLLKDFKHTSYLVNREVIDVKLGSLANYNLKFCSNGGQNNGLGAILKNVSFVKLLNPTSAEQTSSIAIPELATAVPLPLDKPVLTQLQPPTTSGSAPIPGTLPPNPILPTPTATPSPVPTTATPSPVPTTATPSPVPTTATPSPVPTPKPATSQQSLTLKSHSGTCFERSFDLKGGDITLTFDYKLSITGVKESTTFVTVNGKPIYKALPCDNGNSLKLEGNLPKGSHVIGFCPAGSIMDQPHEISLSKVSLTEKPSVLSQ